jgi:DNA repair exonuclease SbcCD ATPase subunit
MSIDIQVLLKRKGRLRIAVASSAADLKCPACSKKLEEPEFDDASREMQKNISKLFGEQSRKRKEEFGQKISELRETHRRDVQAAAKKYEAERKSLLKRLDEQIRKGREIREHDLREAKKNYQMQLEDIRNIYQNQMEEMKKLYEQMAGGNQTQMEKLQKGLHEELVDQPFKKIALMEQEKMSAEQQIANLVQQLNDKNTEVIFLQERVKQLEEKVPSELKEQSVEEHQMDSKYQTVPDEIEGSEQKEWLDMIKELAQQHENKEDVQEPEEEQKTWGSKVAKKFGLL